MLLMKNFFCSRNKSCLEAISNKVTLELISKNSMTLQWPNGGKKSFKSRTISQDRDSVSEQKQLSNKGHHFCHCASKLYCRYGARIMQ